MPLLVGSVIGALLLGILQGLTEFLPISSSGHLALFQAFIEVPGDDVFFDLVLHLGTLAPAIWFFRADLRAMLHDAMAREGDWWSRPGVRMAWLVVLASIPTVLIGLGLKDVFEAQFSSPTALGVGFLLSGVWLWATRGMGEQGRDLMDVPAWAAIAMGVAQGISISPSISRSGATIATALLLGLRRDIAVRLSFVMSIPAILGAVLLKARDVDAAHVAWGEAAIGTAASLVVGYASLVLLVQLVQKGRLAWFAWYLWALGVACFVIL